MSKFRFTASIAALAVLAVAPAVASGKKTAFRLAGTFVEGCSCPAVCGCEITGVKMGCQGVGGTKITHGSFDGKDISGVTIAYATQPGDWVRCYVDAPNKAKMDAASALCKAVYPAFGKYEGTQAAKISITGSGGNMKLTVNGGKVMALSTKPVLGYNHKPVGITNMNDPLHPNVFSGQTVSGKFSDNGHEFELKGSNAFYNSAVTAGGSL